ncbi:MAG: PAS domain S-box protein [Anaerolineae bacterium]|nr:PAS domain S-box protein [Anaerolineae bacterium]
MKEFITTRKVPLRFVLIALFVLQVFLITALVGYFSFRNGQRAVNTVAGRLRGEINARIEDHLMTFLETPHRINRLNADALSQGWVPSNDQAILESYFWRQIQTFESVTSIYFGNTAGGLVDAGREGATGQLYVIVTDGFAQGPFHKYATDDQGRRITETATLLDFDARTRSWYTEAISREAATWGPVYILFTGQDMAISASSPVYDRNRQLLGVVSVDLFLSHLSDFLHSLDIGQTGQSFIMERSGQLIASSTDESLIIIPPDKGPAQRLAAVNSADPLTHAAAAALSEHFGNYRAITAEQHLEFTLNGQRQFLYVSPLRNRGSLDWLIVTVIPEAEFMAQINDNNRATWLISIAIALFTIGIGIVIAQWIAHPVARLNIAAQALAEGNWDWPAFVDTHIHEISRLTDSFGYMAGQLRQMWEALTAEIASRHRVEADLRVNLEKYQILFEAFPLGITVSDKNGQIIEANHESVRILGLSAEEHRKRRIDDSKWKIVRPDGTSMPVEEYASIRALREGQLVENVQMGVVREDGQTVWLSATAAPIPLEDYGVAVAYGDVTRLKQIEAERERLIAELQAALVQVKQLSGLLPICASCKKIRDDRGYWQQVEVYIEKHSEVEFSHGICPDCMAKLYPDTYQKLQPGRQKILDVLNQSGPTTLDALSAMVGLSFEDTLTHVQLMVEENQIEQTAVDGVVFYRAHAPAAR